MIRGNYSREDVVKAVERKGTNKVPLAFHKWWGDGFEKLHGEKLNKMFDKYPEDIYCSFYKNPGKDKSSTDNKSYRWGYKGDYNTSVKHSIGENIILLPDWNELDLFLNDFPNPNETGTFDDIKKDIYNAGNRYKLGSMWGLLHERLWMIRGMENLMCDYYENMDGLKIIARRLIDYYKVIVDRYAKLGFDGYFTSDDLGHQTGPMMSPDTFRELYYPFYKEMADYVHSKGMHFWLHSCGDNTLLMDMLIDAGVDVFHPVQRGCMDIHETAKKYNGKITFMAGFDVQHILPEGTPQQVKEHVEELVKTFRTSEGGLVLSAGNGIMPGIPLENVEMMLKTMTNPK